MNYLNILCLERWRQLMNTLFSKDGGVHNIALEDGEHF